MPAAEYKATKLHKLHATVAKILNRTDSGGAGNLTPGALDEVFLDDAQVTPSSPVVLFTPEEPRLRESAPHFHWMVLLRSKAAEDPGRFIDVDMNSIRRLAVDAQQPMEGAIFTSGLGGCIGMTLTMEGSRGKGFVIVSHFDPMALRFGADEIIRREVARAAFDLGGPHEVKVVIAGQGHALGPSEDSQRSINIVGRAVRDAVPAPQIKEMAYRNHPTGAVMGVEVQESRRGLVIKHNTDLLPVTTHEIASVTVTRPPLDGLAEPGLDL